MNNKETTLYKIIDNVVLCCATQISEDGKMNITRDDVIGKSRLQNVVMTRCIFTSQAIGAGYSIATIAQVLHRTEHAIRHLVEVGRQFHETSRAYRIAHAEATLLCKEL